MKQRVGLARALTPDPQVVLMGEPFTALDGLTRNQLYNDIQRIWQESCKTIVFVTYKVREAVCLAPRLVLLLREPGRVSQIFDIPLPHPRDINSPELASCASRLRQLLRAPQQRCPNTTPRFYAPQRRAALSMGMREGRALSSATTECIRLGSIRSRD
jgi:ABC-type nitrate/sulfonate/bicarbonate transport system ATPase subunit